jgi:hypothetical protein
MHYSSKLVTNVLWGKLAVLCLCSLNGKQCKRNIPNFYLTETYSGVEFYKQLETLHYPYTIFHLQTTISLYLKYSWFPILTYTLTFITFSFIWLCLLSLLVNPSIFPFTFITFSSFLPQAVPYTGTFILHDFLTLQLSISRTFLHWRHSVWQVPFSQQFWTLSPVTLFTCHTVCSFIDPKSVSDCIQRFSENSLTE